MVKLNELNLDGLSVKYCAIREIPGYKLSKPIEVALLESMGDDKKITYFACHTLPAYTKTIEKNEVISGEGRDDGEACKNLGLAIAKKYKDLKNIGDIKLLKPDERIKRQYLEILLEDKIF